MAGATKGKAGGFYVGSTLVTFITDWTLNVTGGMADTTSYGGNWGTKVDTIKDWTMEVSGTLDRTDASQATLLDQLEDAVQAPVVVRASLDRNSEYWQGSAYVAAWNIGHNVRDKVNVSFSLEGTDEITWEGA